MPVNTGNKLKTTLLIRPAARGGKYLGHDAAAADNSSALIALFDPRNETIVDHAYAVAPNAQSAGPLELMGCGRRSDPYAADSGTVQVQLSVEIDKPTDFRVLVYGPLSHPDQARLAQADVTVLPGVDIGLTAQYPEGLVIEVPGLCISNVTADWQGTQVSCTAKVTMMCGCQIHQGTADPYWPWPDTDFSIQLVTQMASGAIHYYPMSYDSTNAEASFFTVQTSSQATQGDSVAQAWIYASEPKLGNQGSYPIPASSSSPSAPASSLPPALQQILLKAGKL